MQCKNSFNSWYKHLTLYALDDQMTCNLKSISELRRRSSVAKATRGFDVFPASRRRGIDAGDCHHLSSNHDRPGNWLAVRHGLPCNDFVWPRVSTIYVIYVTIESIYALYCHILLSNKGVSFLSFPGAKRTHDSTKENVYTLPATILSQPKCLVLAPEAPSLRWASTRYILRLI